MSKNMLYDMSKNGLHVHPKCTMQFKEACRQISNKDISLENKFMQLRAHLPTVGVAGNIQVSKDKTVMSGELYPCTGSDQSICLTAE